MPKLQYRTLLNLLDWLLPPRQSDLTVRTLSNKTLSTKVLHDGALPYHDEAVRALVWEVKYHKAPRAVALAGAHLGEQLLAAAAEELGVPLLIPVPMYPARRRARGHNQAETLCEAALSALCSGGTPPPSLTAANRIALHSAGGTPPTLHTGDNTARKKVWRKFRRLVGTRTTEDFFPGSVGVSEYAPNMLIRTRNTPQQQKLEKHVRLKNVRGSMKVRDATRVAGRVCVVVDDVTTTGATFAEARRALRAAGGRKVVCIALARS